MTRVLLQLTVILMVIFMALIGIVRYSAQAYTAPQKLFSFDPPGCYLPCVFGITPGKTTWGQYKELIASKVPVVQQNSPADGVFWLKDNAGAIIDFAAEIDPNSAPAETIPGVLMSSPDKPFATLGNLVSTQGQPTRVWRQSGLGVEVLYFMFGEPQRIATYTYVDNELTPDTPIDLLFIGDNAYTTLHDAFRGYQNEEIRWLGFASVEKYLDEPIKQ